MRMSQEKLNMRSLSQDRLNRHSFIDAYPESFPNSIPKEYSTPVKSLPRKLSVSTPTKSGGESIERKMGSLTPVSSSKSKSSLDEEPSDLDGCYYTQEPLNHNRNANFVDYEEGVGIPKTKRTATLV